MPQDLLSKVAEFHSAFDVPQLPNPQLRSKQRSQLRVTLLQEELNELAGALDANNIVEVADALCDLQYVLNGAILEFGLQNQFSALFNEVHRSNMSKACNTLQEAQQTVAYYLNQKTPSYIVERENNYIIYRSSDHKVLKSVDYSPPKLESIL